MNGVCKLCGALNELKHSHITPDFYIKSREALITTGSRGGTQPHSFVASTQPDFKDGWMQRNHWEKRLGWKEHLLCGDCEQRFAVHESNIRIFLYGNAPLPLRKRTLGAITTFLPPVAPAEFLEIREVGIDYPELKLYQMSLLWRAGVANGEFFSNIFLGEKHEKRLRTFLVNDDPGSENDYPCVMFDLRSRDVNFEDYCEQPTKARDDNGKRTYRIITGGYAFLYSISTGPPSQMFRVFSARPSGKMLLPVVNGERFLQRCAVGLKQAGKLPDQR